MEDGSRIWCFVRLNQKHCIEKLTNITNTAITVQRASTGCALPTRVENMHINVVMLLYKIYRYFNVAFENNVNGVERYKEAINVTDVIMFMLGCDNQAYT